MSVFFLDVMHLSNVCQRIVDECETKVIFELFKSDTCKSNAKFIIVSFIRLRVHYAVMFFNKMLAEQPRNKQNRKALKLQHM